MTYVNFSCTTIIVLVTRDTHSLPSRCKPHSYMKNGNWCNSICLSYSIWRKRSN